MNFAISGISGRMGTTIYRIIHQRGHSLHAGFESPASPFIGNDAGLLIGLNGVNKHVSEINADKLKGADAVIDFTSPSATMILLESAVSTLTPIVIGSTGFDDAEKKLIFESAKRIPVLFTPNMSVGVNLLFKILEKAAQILPDGYDIEISESHHKFRKDAPSGTALHLLDIVKKNSPHHANAKAACSREGMIGERNPDEIGMQVLRGGDIVGEHTVYFVGMGERIELSHRATSRDNFAMGAVRAAEYIAGKNAGLYSIEDVVGLK